MEVMVNGELLFFLFKTKNDRYDKQKSREEKFTYLLAVEGAERLAKDSGS
jgi:hypothetical protein